MYWTKLYRNLHIYSINNTHSKIVIKLSSNFRLSKIKITTSKQAIKYNARVWKKFQNINNPVHTNTAPNAARPSIIIICHYILTSTTWWCYQVLINSSVELHVTHMSRDYVVRSNLQTYFTIPSICIIESES